MADEPTTEVSETEVPNIEEPPTETPATLGENGVKALQAERNARQTAEKQLKQLSAELDALRAEQMTEQERALVAARSEAADAAKAEVVAQYESRLLEATIRAQAAGRFRDPSDALKHLDVQALPRREDGTIDDDAIGAAIDTLLAEKSYLGVPNEPAWPDVNGGPQGTSVMGTFTRAQLRDATFYQANKEAILLAQREGRITD